ncbi:MAG: acyltransferase family protein [Proteobacteria bacterium]|nr:acyltransferase family protein [Pseudomonadota bacterium]
MFFSRSINASRAVTGAKRLAAADCEERHVLSREESNYFYNIRGILILLVVLGHVLEQFYFSSGPARFLYQEIYFFHMPMFIIMAGYFSYASLRIMPLVQGLIYPYVIMQIIYAASDHFLFGSTFLEAMLRPNWGMWFLIAVFVWRLIWPFIHRLPYLLPIATLLAVAAGNIDAIEGVASRIFVFLPFFVLGCKWSQRGGREQALEWVRRYGPAVFLVGIAAHGVFLWGDYAPAWFYGSLSYASLGETQWWAGGIRLLTLAGAGMGICLCLSLAPARTSWLTRAGKGSMTIYLVHFLVIDLLRGFHVPAQISAALQDHWAIAVVIAPALAVTIAAFLSLPAVQTVFARIYRPPSRWVKL